MINREDFRELVREKSDLLSIIARTVEIPHRNSGRVVKVRCPFHADDTPSLAIWPDQDRWRCFGSCNEGGDVFAWVMKRDGVDFETARDILARDASMDIPTFEESSSPEERQNREDAQALLKLSADWYHEQLLNNAGAAPHREYLEKRGFDRAIWEKWQIGAAGSRNKLLAYLQSVGADLILAQKIGLIRANDDDGHLYDFFRDRIIIPLIQRGRVVYMTARTIGSSQTKYKHLPNTEFARKVPYNAGTSAKDIVIVEGPLDVWAVDALSDGHTGAMGLLGLGHNDPELPKALKRRDRVFIGTDADGTVKRETVENLIQIAGISRSRLVTWPGGDDPAAWLASGATAEEFAHLLDTAPLWTTVLVQEIAKAEYKPNLVAKAVSVAAQLPPAAGDVMINEIKRAAHGAIQARTVLRMYREAQEVAAPSHNGNGHKPPEPQRAAATDEQPEEPYYWVRDGEIWRGHGNEAQIVLKGGMATWTQMVRVDDGEEPWMDLQLEIRLKSGRVFTLRIPSEVSKDTGKVTSYIAKSVGPLLTIEARQGPYLVPAIEAMMDGNLDEITEIVRTGWVETEAGLAFCTPGGVVGELPEGFKAVAPIGMPNMNRYSVVNHGDDAFRAGLDGLLYGFLQSFEPIITFPLLAYAILPVAARYMPKHKFAMHISGETGSLKTSASKVLMSLYGDFVDAPAIQSWRSTVNSIEQTGFWLPDVLGLIDDYKPSVVKPWDFTELIQRYADGNDRSRLGRDGKMRSRQAMRWWILSTGEDLPGGEASVLARMVTIRFPRRPQGAAYNTALGKAQAAAHNFPTVTARWAAWLAGGGITWNVQDKMLNYHEFIANALQAEASEVPNVNRLSRNVAMLWTAWDMWWDFIAATFGVPGVKMQALKRAGEFGALALPLAVQVARQVIQEKPVHVFLNALQEGLDSGRFRILPRNETSEGSKLDVLAGWYDKDGIYILPAMYLEIAKMLREGGQQIGFTKNELYRLLDEEGALVRKGKTETTDTIQVGPPGALRSKRVLLLQQGLIATPPLPAPPSMPDFGR